MKAEDQPRFKNSDDCYFKSIMEESNCWYIVHLVERNDTDQDDIDEENEEILNHITSYLAQTIEIGGYGAVATADEDSLEGYYLVEFLGLPYTDQETGALKCDCNWLNPVPRARMWYTKSNLETKVNLVNVVATQLELMPISPSNMISNRGLRRDAEAKNAMNISVGTHNSILDEIKRRERLEYDPSRVYTGEMAESESDSDEE